MFALDGEPANDVDDRTQRDEDRDDQFELATCVFLFHGVSFSLPALSVGRTKTVDGGEPDVKAGLPQNSKSSREDPKSISG